MGQPEEEKQTASPVNFTALLRDWEVGDSAAFDRLVEMAYPELRRIARLQCRSESPISTLQCTAVVHEAWLRLAQAQPISLKDRTHFFAFSAWLMRTILVDHARARKSQKRGGGAERFTLLDSDAVTAAPEVELLELNDALNELEMLDPAQSRLIELRYFSGLSIPETAEAMGISESTVKREWMVAKTWIRRRLVEGKRQS
jgi:RNA polymerase sigma factor (TIGR02999 family)